MEDASFYRKREQEALREAEEADLPNARAKFLSAAAAWASMAQRKNRVRNSDPAPEVAAE